MFVDLICEEMRNRYNKPYVLSNDLYRTSYVIHFWYLNCIVLYCCNSYKLENE